MSHAEFAKKQGIATPCTAHHVNFGGDCLNCGYVPPLNRPKGEAMSTHTPGPWELIARSDNSVNIEKSDGTIRSVIAEIRDGSLCEEHGDYRANARLIAASLPLRPNSLRR